MNKHDFETKISMIKLDETLVLRKIGEIVNRCVEMHSLSAAEKRRLTEATEALNREFQRVAKKELSPMARLFTLPA